MLPGQKVIVGKYYVNDDINIVRKVLDVKATAVTFVSYHFDTGNSAGIPSVCMKQHFAHWADREATSAEISILERRRLGT